MAFLTSGEDLPVKAIGIDPGLAMTGFGVVEALSRGGKACDWGAIRTESDCPISLRLKIIYDGIKELLEKRHFLVNGKEAEVELVDIETEEGFKLIFPELEGVPSAYQEGKRCKIRIEEDTLFLECPNNEDPGT